jgi:hypothetical protein
LCFTGSKVGTIYECHKKKAVLGNNEKCSETTATASHDFAKGDFVGVVYNEKWHLGNPLMSVSV